jgi:hypothetical protein
MINRVIQTNSRDITAQDIKKLLLRVYKRYQGGAITESQAQKEAYLLNSVLRAIETADLEERLQMLETYLKD